MEVSMFACVLGIILGETLHALSPIYPVSRPEEVIDPSRLCITFC